MTKLQCLECGKIIESRHTHDYNTCGCPNNAMIDGGNDYLRYGCVDETKIKIIEDVKRCDVCKNQIQYCSCGKYNVFWKRIGVTDYYRVSLNKSNSKV